MASIKIKSGCTRVKVGKNIRPNFYNPRVSRVKYESLQKKKGDENSVNETNVTHFSELSKLLESNEYDPQGLNCSQVYDNSSMLKTSGRISREKYSSDIKRKASTSKSISRSFSSPYEHPLGHKILLKADKILKKGEKYSPACHGRNRRANSIQVDPKKATKKTSFTSLLKKYHKPGTECDRRKEKDKDCSFISQFDANFRDLEEADPDEVQSEVPVRANALEKIQGIDEDMSKNPFQDFSETRIKIVHNTQKVRTNSCLRKNSQQMCVKPILKNTRASHTEQVRESKAGIESSRRRREMMKEVNDIIGELQSILHPKGPGTCESDYSQTSEVVKVNSSSMMRSRCNNLSKTEGFRSNQSNNSAKENFYHGNFNLMEWKNKEVEKKFSNNFSNSFYEKLHINNNCQDLRAQKGKRVLIGRTNQK
ncbi:unnamed protein product [Moneuplotes crassus]|uniref:Uncharacterized protein n=1 Tax=Euplotes crassus TaxID=5936 RepID=A0AAD1U6N6_EUPCR|nr:unnamed protein product [Moneuplotes crassus]